MNIKPTSIPKPKPLNISETWALFGLNRHKSPRYKGLKGIYWYVFSMYIRQRDFKMWHRCVSCNKWVDTWEELQAGHYIAAGNGGFDLLFDTTNVNGECAGCNGFDQNHLVGYEVGLDERYGKGTAAALKQRYMDSKKVGAPTQKAWGDKEYTENIHRLQGEIVLL